MPWRNVEPCALPLIPAIGLFMGFLTSNLGLRSKVEFPVWAVLYLPVAAVAAVDGWSDFALFIGLSALGGLRTGTLQAWLMENYGRNNPWYADQMPADKAAAFRRFLPFGAVMAALFGAIFAGVLWGLSTLLG